MRQGSSVLSPRQCSVSRELEIASVEGLTKRRVGQNSSITGSPVAPHIDDPEAVVCVDNCQENDGKRSLVVEELLTEVRRGLQNYMLPIDGTTAEREVPPLLEPLCNHSPLLCSGHSHELLHQAVPNSRDHIRDDGSHGGGPDPEAVGDRSKRITTSQESASHE